MKCVTVATVSLVGNLNFYNVYITVSNQTPVQGVEVTVYKYLNPQTNSFVNPCSVAYLSGLCNNPAITDDKGQATLCMIPGIYIIELSYQGYVNYATIMVSKNEEFELPFYFSNFSPP